jgi:hypothetical protein
MSETVQFGQGAAAAKRAYWDGRITQWERSGQTQRAFCAERGLVLSTFQWWRARAKRREAAKAVAPFLPIAMHAVSVVEVELRSRTRIRFEGEAALQAVAQLTARVK